MRGTSLTVGATLRVDSASSSHAAGTSTFTNSGGTLNANSTAVGTASGTATGKLVISGGVNNLGNVTVGRYGTASASTLGATEGLNIFGGVVTMSNLTCSGASYGTAYISAGTVTNFGNVSINGATPARYLRVVQAGGLFVVPDPGIIYENTTTAGAETARYQVTGGTNIVGGFALGVAGNTAAATATVTIGGSVYVGSQGIVTNGAILATITLSSGGRLGATTPWTGSSTMNLSGSGVFTFQTADMSGNPNNITNNGALNGPSTCALNVTGGGTLTLGATNTYAGTTLINGGKLALGANSALASPLIIVGPERRLTSRPSAVGFVLNNLQTLSGSGTVNGAVALASGATITSGSNALTGTLTLNNSLTETNGSAVNHFVLSGGAESKQRFDCCWR